MCIKHMGRIYSAVPPRFLLFRCCFAPDDNRHFIWRNVPYVLHYYHFAQAAPVGNSDNYLNRRELTAADSLSLAENNLLLTPSQLFIIKIYLLF